MPTPDDEAIDAIYLLTKPSQRKIIRFLLGNPDSYRGQIHEGTGLPLSSIGRIVPELEAHKIVTGDGTPSDRGRYPIKFRVDTDFLDTLIDRLRADLLG